MGAPDNRFPQRFPRVTLRIASGREWNSMFQRRKRVALPRRQTDRAKFQEKFWPPAAVLAWIIWRSPAVVKECWGGSIETIREKLDQDGPLAHVFDYAMERLLSVLRQDRVSSSGKRDEAWDPEDITAKQWALGRLRFATDAQGKDYITNEEHVPEEGDADDIWNTIERNEQKRSSALRRSRVVSGQCTEGFPYAAAHLSTDRRVGAPRLTTFYYR